ncbi:hypothetical protein CES85_3424 (plasmid) [Ochrobactrum quorumnocens]|uniref:Uncharacterized protein n=1 Tax=Ochrobactrum quorumnocens TaxID=271865 RepID=A0A248UM75_9HYPH|nr:hypothetical protein CES85_3424 [[Ochrobactrum] quorumnocens]
MATIVLAYPEISLRGVAAEFNNMGEKRLSNLSSMTLAATA